MKKNIWITLCFSTIFTAAFAQSQAEGLVQAAITEYQKNPLKAFQEHASDSYVLISGNGHIAGKSETASILKNISHLDIRFQDLKVRQTGNVIIATGKENTIRHYGDGTPDLTTDYLVTYIFEIKGDKLIYLSAQHTDIAPETQVEEETIKKMLSEETIDAYAAKNVDNYFVQQPHTFRGWNVRIGYESDMGWAAIKKKNETAFNTRPRQMNPINENFTFKFYGNDACVVTYDQYLYGKENIPSKEIRIVEKHNGIWKISGLIALWDFSGNAFEQANVRKTIESETNAYHAGDVEGMNKQWAMKANYVERMHTSLKNFGVPVYLKGDQLRSFAVEFKKTAKPTEQTYKISDYDAHIGTTYAWVTYTQEVFNTDGKMAHKTRELRILERVDGWKIVTMTHIEL